MSQPKFSIVIVILLLLTSCSVFDTREPEEPQDGGGSTFIQPEQASDVIRNLQSAVAEMNTDNYSRSISDLEYTFEPSSRAQDWSGWENWNQNDERDYFNNMASSAEDFGNHQLQLENIEEEGSDPEIRISAEYTLEVNHGRDTDDLPTIATGELILDLERGEDDGLWEIVRWIDLGDGSDFTWSDFRQEFSQ